MKIQHRFDKGQVADVRILDDDEGPLVALTLRDDNGFELELLVPNELVLLDIRDAAERGQRELARTRRRMHVGVDLAAPGADRSVEIHRRILGGGDVGYVEDERDPEGHADRRHVDTGGDLGERRRSDRRSGHGRSNQE